MKHSKRLIPRYSILGKLGLLGLILTLAPFAPLTPVQAAGGKYVVTSTLDTSDANPGDNVCKDAGGVCTLRAAVEEANAHAGKDTITFKITSSPGPWTISPSTALPAITEAVTLDASAAGAGASCKTTTVSVTIDGSGAGGSASGFVLSGQAANGSLIKGFSIVSFSLDGIMLDRVSSALVKCNIIGLQRDGVTAAGNGQAAVEIAGNGAAADLNLIGGVATDRNILSGNNYGVLISNIVDPAAKGNKIQSNYIGTDITGTLARGNGSTGIYLSASPKTTIGGTNKLANVISGNGYGIYGASSADGTLIQGNTIGLDKTGQAALGNTNGGVIFSGSSGLIIGGKSPTYSNIISGNTTYGVYLNSGSNNAVIQGNTIGMNATGTFELKNTGTGIFLDSSTGATIGGTTSALRNLISGNTLAGINLNNHSENAVVQGNFIGVDKTGYYIVPNGGEGVKTQATSGVVIGGNSAAARNVISGNTNGGVTIDTSTSGTKIQGNYIGTNVAGTAALGNQSAGVSLLTCTGCLVGGSASAGERNLISGNAGPGVSISGGSGSQVFGNYIGTDATGAKAMPNATGISSNTSSGNQFGSSSSALARNVISGNTSDGVDIANDTGDTLQGNIIGLNAAGTAALTNGGYGLSLYNGQNVLIGGPSATARNIISGNYYYGMYVSGPSGNNNHIQGNYIGLNLAGTAAIGNGQSGGSSYPGVYISQTGTTFVGGTGAGEGNVISGNLGAGVQLSTVSVSTVIDGNYIGLNAAGTAAVGNAANGIDIYNSAGTIIGEVGAGNVISGNGSSGIQLETSANSTTFQANKIGTNAAGTAAVPNRYSGIGAYSLTGLTIGGSNPGEGNIISGNLGDGISIGQTVTGTITVRGNAIGTDLTQGLVLGNAQAGINSSAASTLINNRIAFNAGQGITQYYVPVNATSTGNCLFYNLSSTGIFSYNTGAQPFNGNWWGSALGPGSSTIDPARQAIANSGTSTTTDTSPLGAPPSGCLVANGGQLITTNQNMETDSSPADGIPDDWTPTSVVVASGEGRRSDSAFDGLYSLKMIGGGATKVTRTVTAVGGNAGHSVVLGFWTRGVGVTGSGLYQASVKVGTATFTYDIPVDVSGSTGGWVQHTLNFVAPASFTSATITLTYTKPYGSAWWDDISLLDLSIAP